jgi:type IV pilus assembly protein PilP
MSMKFVHGSNLKFAAAIVTLALLSGCTGGDDDLRQWVKDEKGKKGVPVPPLPVLRTFETFEYTYKDNDPDVRDPFGLSVADRQEAHSSTNNGPQPDQHPKEPMESYPLDSLKMVGTIGGGPGIEALVKDPEGVVHRVHMHNYLGQNNGKVTAIAEDHIDLVELVSNGTGGWMEHQAKIALGEK